jgi:hypothetical protein
VAGKSQRLGRAPSESLDDLSDDVLLGRAHRTLLGLVGDHEARAIAEVADDLLTPRATPSRIDSDGMRAMLFQLTRNKDPEMQANHLTELRVAASLAGVRGRFIEIERRASARNERRVDFGLDDPDGTTLVEVKNLNAPMIKKATDPLSEELRRGLGGSASATDLHLVYLFFRRPRGEELEPLECAVRARWEEADGRFRERGRGRKESSVFYAPADRPRVAGLVVPARPDTGGRVIVYDHGQHLHREPGQRIRVSHQEVAHRRGPRERIEEMFVKDNILRRLQDAEQKFPLEEEALRVVLFCQGEWAPVSHVDRYLDEAVAWYRSGQATDGDLWERFYPHHARRWSFSPAHNIDAILAVRPEGATPDDPVVEPSRSAPGRVVEAGDIRFSVRPVYARYPSIVDRVFFGL